MRAASGMALDEHGSVCIRITGGLAEPAVTIATAETTPADPPVTAILVGSGVQFSHANEPRGVDEGQWYGATQLIIEF